MSDADAVLGQEDGETAAANIAIEQEIKALKENALKKEAEAVELVISKLV